MNLRQPTQFAVTTIDGIDVSTIILHLDSGDMAETVVFLDGQTVKGLTEYQTVRGGKARDQHDEVCMKVRDALNAPL